MFGHALRKPVVNLPLRSFCLAVVGLAALALTNAGCGNNHNGEVNSAGVNTTPSTTGKITTQITDNASQCTTPNGPSYKNVFVTVSDVTAVLTNSAHPDQDLTPNLEAKPLQVDLLAAPVIPPGGPPCLLTILDSTSGLLSGSSSQLVITLVANGATGVVLGGSGTNACASLGATVFNCVVDAGGAHTLDLPSDATTGIAVTPVGGSVSLPLNGGAATFDLDVNACASVAPSPAGDFNLKPTMQAGALGASPLIGGQVILGTVSGTPPSVTVPATSAAFVPVPSATVWLEQQSRTVGSDTVENFIQSAQTDPTTGNFQFCPVFPGTYDVVADSEALPGSPVVPSNATVTTGVGAGVTNLVIPLVAETSPPINTLIDGLITTAGVVPPGAGDIITFYGLQAFPSGASTIQALIPFFPSSPSISLPSVIPSSLLTTVGSGTGFDGQPDCLLDLGLTCPLGVNCACYALGFPISNPVVGAASTSGTGYSAPAADPVFFSVDAAASSIATGSPECSLSEQVTATFSFAAGGVVTAPTLHFTGCD